MQLTKDEEKMLSGGYAKAIEELSKFSSTGEFYDARRLVLLVCVSRRGPSPSKPGKASEWLNELADLGTTSSALWRSCLLIREASPITNFTRNSRRIRTGRSGHHVTSLSSCFRQHITADGTAITHYMNSYVGARANTECFVGQYSAAIVGKTPEYGFHLAKNRVGKTLFDVKVELKDEPTGVLSATIFQER